MVCCSVVCLIETKKKFGKILAFFGSYCGISVYYSSVLCCFGVELKNGVRPIFEGVGGEVG